MKTKNISRFNARLKTEEKELYEKAADIGGFKSLSDFVLSSAHKEAVKIIKEHERIIATREDQEKFVNAILNPKEPTEAMKKAAGAYKASDKLI